MVDSPDRDELKQGEIVKSEIEDVGRLKEIFNVLDRGEPFVLGVGLTISPSTLEINPDLQRYYKALEGTVWDPGNIQTDRDEAVRVLLEKIADDYRRGGLLEKYPQKTHQIFGEIRRYVLGDPRENPAGYDDRLPHIDFVPPDDPCFAYFFAGSHPTKFWELEFPYRGNLHPTYEKDIKERGGILRELPSGHLYRTKQARALIHASPSDFQRGELRTFGRLYAGPVA